MGFIVLVVLASYLRLIKKANVYESMYLHDSP
jgi:hypothetical protein